MACLRRSYAALLRLCLLAYSHPRVVNSVRDHSKPHPGIHAAVVWCVPQRLMKYWKGGNENSTSMVSCRATVWRGLRMVGGLQVERRWQCGWDRPAHVLLPAWAEARGQKGWGKERAKWAPR